MIFWIDFLRDKRFSWKFKLANLIMGDSLRNCLGYCLGNLGKIEDLDPNAYNAVLMQRYSTKARAIINELMSL